jgi:hypothetical protein
MLRKLRNRFIKRGTQSDVGRGVGIIMNPQGVKDFGENPKWNWGIIEEVSECGSLFVRLNGGGLMVCIANKYGRRRNPFQNLRM